MACLGPMHFNQQYASTTQFWSGTDSKRGFKINCANERTYKKLKQLGWIDTELLYKFNSEGFRDNDFDQQPAGLALGCSHTQGVGIQDDNTWPRQLEKMLGQKVWNLGVGGSALDTCYRVLEYWIDQLNIKFVVCAVPDISRYEVFTGSWLHILPSSIIPPWLHDYQKNYLFYDQNSNLNRRKNLLAMQNICDKHDVLFYYDLLEKSFFGNDNYARDLMHSGPASNHYLAKTFANKINTQGKI